MKFIKVGNMELAVLKSIIREKGADIGRPGLGDVNSTEIKVLQLSQTQHDKKVYLCYVRGMSYKVDTNTGRISIAIFDPEAISIGNGSKVKNCPTYI